MSQLSTHSVGEFNGNAVFCQA